LNIGDDMIKRMVQTPVHNRIEPLTKRVKPALRIDDEALATAPASEAFNHDLLRD